MAAIRLIAGLGNPGARYAATRHNVGAVFVRQLAEEAGLRLEANPRFKGDLARGELFGSDVRLLLPTTYMNASGESVGPVASYFRIEPEEILVAYDEVAFEPGVARLKQGGGPNGHNGVRSVIAGLGNRREFVRLRIGVGHPGDREDMVAYLTARTPPAEERERIARALEVAREVLPLVIGGDLQRAMTQLHSETLG